MKFKYALIALLVTAHITSAVANTAPADSAIQAAQADYIRFAEQSQGLTSARASNAKRILKLMKLSRDRLESSPNKKHASWIETAKLYDDLQSQLEALLVPAVSSSTTQQTQSAAPTTNSTNTTQQSNSATISAGSISETQTDVRPLVSGERVRVKKLTNDMNNVRNALVVTGPSSFQRASELEGYQKRFNQFTEALKRYPQVDDSDVSAAREEYLTLRNLLKTEFERAKQQLAELGDAQQRLRTLAENSQAYPVPESIRIPFSQEEAIAWVKSASDAETVAKHSVEQLQQILPLAYLPDAPGHPQNGGDYDEKDALSLLTLSRNVPTEITSRYQSMANALSEQINSFRSQLAERWNEAPDGDKSWIYTQDGREEEAYETMNRFAAAASSAVYLQDALGRPADDARGLLDAIAIKRAQFAERKEIAIDSARLPVAATDDATLLAIASEILQDSYNEYTQHGAIRITTSKIVEREVENSEVEFNKAEVSASGDVKLSGTGRTWTYRWSEFKFATAMKDADSKNGWHIWWLTAKKFSSGDSTTPLDKWVPREVVKGNPIRQEHVGL